MQYLPTTCHIHHLHHAGLAQSSSTLCLLGDAQLSTAGPQTTSGLHCLSAYDIHFLYSQDKVCVQPFKIVDQKCLLLMVCDGHGGPQCAQFFTTQFFKELEKQLPSQIPNWQSASGVARATSMLAVTVGSKPDPQAQLPATNRSAVPLSTITSIVMLRYSMAPC